MDWNTILLWVSGASCLITAVTAFRGSPRPYGWVVACLFILGLGGMLYALRPDQAGYIVGGLWAAVVLAPALLQKSAASRTIRQDYDGAARFATVAGILHPFDGVPQQTAFLRAMALSERGDTAAAIAMLQKLEATASSRTAQMAAINSRKLANDWSGVLKWVLTHVEPQQLLREPGILPTFVRALGETGQLSEMVHVAWAGRLPMHPQLAVYRNTCRLFVFTFCGQMAQVERILSGPLSNLPESVRRYWLATAGPVADCGAQLDALQSIASPGLVHAIEYRRKNPRILADSLLTNADRNLLEQLARQQDQEHQFAHASNGRRRPWVTYLLVMANVVVFAIEWAKGAHAGNWLDGGTMSEQVLDRMGAMQPTVLQTHEYYRLFTANFLHYGYPHIVMNMLALWILGPFVEYSLGPALYALLYLVSCVGVMETVLLLQNRHLMQQETLVGASGAIMAIIGASAAIFLRGWFRDQASVALRRLGAVGVMLAVQIIFDHFTPQVSGGAHMAGMIWGFALATVLPHRGARRNGV